jgi:hypothetical protein
MSLCDSTEKNSYNTYQEIKKNKWKKSQEKSLLKQEVKVA